MLAVQGPQARESLQTVADAPLPARCTVASGMLLGRSALVCGTGYTGEDGVEVLCAPEDAGALWDEFVRRGAAPAGLGARDTLRLEACLPLYGNDLTEERGPIEAGLGWCCKEDTGFIGADAVRAVREAGPAERLRPFRLTGPRHPAAGQRDRGRRRGHERHAVAVPRRRDRHGLPARRPRRRRAPRSRSTSGARPAKPSWPSGPSTARSEMADASYPDDLLYHAEHDWVRLDGDTATFGITWYAQDALGEVVFFDPPEVGSTVTKDESVRRGRVGQGRLRRHRAAVGRDRRGQHRRSATSPRRSTTTRTARAGWSRSSSPTRPRRTRCSTPRPTEARACSREPLHEPPRRRTCGRCSRPSASGRSRSCSSARSPRACGSAGRSTCPPGCPSRTSTRTCATLAARNVSAEDEITFLGAGMYDHYVPARRRHAHGALGVPDAVHALPARGLARAACR